MTDWAAQTAAATKRERLPAERDRVGLEEDHGRAGDRDERAEERAAGQLLHSLSDGEKSVSSGPT